MLAPYMHSKMQSTPAPRFAEELIVVPDFPTVEAAENYLKEIPVLFGRGEIDSQTALELSQLIRNWILSIHARSELELKKITVDGPGEQVIKIQGGLPPLPGAEDLIMPQLNGHAVTNGHAALAAPTDAVPALEAAQSLWNDPNDSTNGHGPCCFVMPARIAATDPYKQINEYVGSGPMRFVKEEWTPGAKAVFEKVADYRPRAEPASWLAGGKRIASDRIEWIIIADQATAAAALQNGEVDWLELPLPDIVPVLRRSRNITVDVADPMGYIGTLFFNHLYPPFNDVRARRAVLMALNQEDYMRAYVGSDDAMWKPLPSYFTPGSALYNEEGGDVLKGRRNLDVAKRLLAESGYRGEPVTSMAAQDIAAHKAWGDVTADLLTHLGVKVDYAAVDWGTVVARRAQKSPPGQGGWQIFHTYWYGVDCVDPTSRIIRANGDKAFFGWPNNPQIEAEVAAWYEAKTLDEERAIARRLNKAAFEHAIYAPARAIPSTASLAYECRRSGAGAPTILLGCQQNGVMAFRRPDSRSQR
jgi:Bacterial extracellular solute-binding proteins, family 5 Middle